MSKRKIITIIAIVILLMSIIGILVNGISFGLAGKFYFTTKFYKTPTDAFLAEYSSVTATSDDVEVENQLDTILIDDNNCMFLAITRDKKLLVASMIVKKEKYACTGELNLYDSDSVSDYNPETGLVMNQTYLYDSKGKCSSVFKWCIAFKEEVQYETYKDFNYKEYVPDNYKSFVLIFE